MMQSAVALLYFFLLRDFTFRGSWASAFDVRIVLIAEITDINIQICIYKHDKGASVHPGWKLRDHMMMCIVASLSSLCENNKYNQCELR